MIQHDEKESLRVAATQTASASATGSPLQASAKRLGGLEGAGEDGHFGILQRPGSMG